MVPYTCIVQDVLKELQGLDGGEEEEKTEEAEKEPTPAEMEEEYEIKTPGEAMISPCPV